ncbi:MAG: IS3 family transposase [Candidatus Eisenbacteria bacterium]
MEENDERRIEGDLPERWSPQRKAEVVLRLIKGEDLGALSREIEVPAHELEEWRRVFLESGTVGLRRRGGDPLERDLRRTQAKLGETMMRLELASDLLEKRGYGEELKRLFRNGKS